MEQMQLLTKQDLTKLFNVSLATVNRILKRGEIKPVKVGLSLVRFRKEDVEAYLSSCTGSGR